MKIGDKIGIYVALSDDGTWEAIAVTEKKQIFGSKGHKTAKDAIQSIMDNDWLAFLSVGDEVFITAEEIEYPHPEGE